MNVNQKPKRRRNFAAESAIVVCLHKPRVLHTHTPEAWFQIWSSSHLIARAAIANNWRRDLCIFTLQNICYSNMSPGTPSPSKKLWTANAKILVWKWCRDVHVQPRLWMDRYTCAFRLLRICAVSSLHTVSIDHMKRKLNSPLPTKKASIQNISGWDFLKSLRCSSDLYISLNACVSGHMQAWGDTI